MDKLPLELIQFIFDFLEFKSQMIFRKICKDYYQNLRVYGFLNIPYKNVQKLNDRILKKFKHLKYLSARNNPKITNVNHLKNLEILIANGEACGIGNKGIKELNL